MIRAKIVDMYLNSLRCRKFKIGTFAVSWESIPNFLCVNGDSSLVVRRVTGPKGHGVRVYG